MGHHGCRGTMAAAMAHRVLSIDVCVVRDLYLPHLPATIRLFARIARAIYPSRTSMVPALVKMRSGVLSMHKTQ